MANDLWSNPAHIVLEAVVGFAYVVKDCRNPKVAQEAVEIHLGDSEESHPSASKARWLAA